jgi:putative tryptophan/tyrosine transport system substrate-binding protein
MRRREFIALLGGAAVAWPLVVYGQEIRNVVRVGTASTFPKNFPLWVAFRARLRELGYVEGQNIAFEFLELADHGSILEEMSELVQRKVDIIIDAGEEVTLKAAMTATTTVPIVMLAVTYDPVVQGYVSSISRATGNVTGLYLRRPELVEKQIGFLTGALPRAVRLAVLGDTNSWNQYRSVEQIAHSLNLNVQPVQLEQPPYDFDVAFRAMAKERAEMLLVLSSSLFGLQRSRIADLAIQHRLPTMFTSKTYAQAGGLFSYGPDITAMFRRAADYVDRLARGAKPTDLPIEQPTKFELAINIKTARALGFDVPDRLLALADEVIE